jgi:DNA-binding PadR family transcriptional regulator
MNDCERDNLRGVILKLISEGHDHWTAIEKRACASGFDFATSNTVKRQFYNYLLAFGYVERVERGRYALTDKGKSLLALLS